MPQDPSPLPERRAPEAAPSGDGSEVGTRRDGGSGQAVPASSSVGSAAALPPPAARTSKRRPQPRLRALGEEAIAVADWASLFGDLARRPSVVPEADPPV